MNHVPLLHVHESTHHLSDDVSRFFLLEVFVLLKSLVQIAEACIFKYHIQASFIIEVSIEANYVRMSEPPLYLKFFLHLRKKGELFEQVLFYHLQCHMFV